MIASSTSAPILQPLRLGELLDRAIRLYRKNFLTLIGIIALVQVLPVVLQTLISIVAFAPTAGRFSTGAPPPTDPSQVFTPAYILGQLATLVMGVIGFYLGSLGRAAIARVAADSYLHNQPSTILGAYGKLGRPLLRLLLALTLMLVLGFALLIWWIVPCFGWFTGIGMFIYGIGVIYPFTVACCVLEGQGAFGSLRRAWDLTRRRFWRTVGFMFLLYVFSIAITLGPTVVMSSLLGVIFNADIFVSNPEAVFILQTIVQSVTTLAISIVYAPIQIVAEVLMYFDLRVRTEGFDLALSAAGSEAGAADVLAQAPRPESGRPITGREFAYFVLLSFVVMLPFLLFYLFLVILFIFIIAAAASAAGG